MQASFATLHKLKVLHDIGQINFFSRQLHFGERGIEQLPGRADERLTGQVLRIARLFADEHDARVCRAAAKDSLGRVTSQFASRTTVCGCGAALAGTPELYRNASPSQCADSSGVRMLQCICENRCAKNGAARRTIKCSGRCQATKRSAPR